MDRDYNYQLISCSLGVGTYSFTYVLDDLAL